MKVVVIFHRKEGTKPEDFQPLVEAEDKHGLSLYRDDVLRDFYTRAAATW